MKGHAGSVGILLLLVLGCCCIPVPVFADELSAMFAAVPSSGPSPLTVSFVDQSEGMPVSWVWDFDDDADSSDIGDGNPNPNHTYTVPGIYTPVLTVDNDTATPASNSPWIGGPIVVEPPVLTAGFAPSVRYGFAPLNVTFIDKSVGNINTWNWNFDFTDVDPDTTNSSSEPIPSHTYTKPGVYSVNLTIADNYSTSDALIGDIITVYPEPAPESDFSASPRSGTAPLEVVFTPLTRGSGNFTYQWYFDDHTPISRDPTPVHVFTEAGVYNVTMEVNGSSGSTLVNKTGYIAVSTPPPPTADFAVAPAEGVAPLTVSFIGLSNATGNLHYTWDFGDHSTVISGRNPTHTYEANGTFTVNCTVSDGSRTSTVSRENCVRVLPEIKPQAMFTAYPRSGSVPLEVSFIDQSKGDWPVSWEWYFGDDTPKVYDQNPVHVFEKAGLFNVTLMIHAANGEAILNQTGFVNVTEYKVPNVSFSMAPVYGVAPLRVSFIDQTCRQNCAYEYFWQFGDGNYSRNKSPVWEYRTPGNYHVNLTVTDPSGVSVTGEALEDIWVTDQWNANGPLISNFTANPIRGKNPLSVQFFDATTGTPVAWNWSFGDGTFSGNQSPLHVYSDANNYTVQLETFDKNGNNSVKTKTDYIEVVSNQVTSRFVASYPDYPDMSRVFFNDASDGKGMNWWRWDFGDGTFSYEKSPYHIYSGSSCRVVSHEVSNGFVNGSSAKTVCT